MDRINQRKIRPNASLLEAMKKMDTIGVKTLLVFDADKFIGLLTIGDIQRAIIKGTNLSSSIFTILDKNKIYASIFDSQEVIQNNMKTLRAECMPVLDQNNELVDVLFWKDIFLNDDSNQREKIDLPVVIMAGGKGTRLKPLTNIIPKPLIPVGEKTILEEIMNQFETIGCTKFHMSVNYKYDMIEYYLSQLEHKYDISFFQEEKPLGTIGSVALLKGKITTPFFVSNCDILINQDYRDVYEYHISNKNDITIVTAIKTYTIPYGVIETEEGGIMTGLSEKPEFNYMINTGVYILNPELIDLIPEGEFFHITHLMEKVRKNGGKVGCFPVSNGAWRDMGEWPEYLKMINVL
jgi:dTDP-glucose pyrophosphorylase